VPARRLFEFVDFRKFLWQSWRDDDPDQENFGAYRHFWNGAAATSRDQAREQFR
jgi:hypothetical protein